MNQTYLCKFDSAGKRGETLLACEFTKEEKQQKIADGYIEITEEDWNYYVGNNGAGDNGTGYVRDPQTGKPVSAPPYVPTKEEKLAQLDAQYDSDKAELTKYYTDALLSDDTETQEELKAEMQELDAGYTTKRKEIEVE